MIAGNLRNSAVHTWMQNEPFNKVIQGNGSSFSASDYFYPDGKLDSLPDQSTGKATLYTKSAAIYQTLPTAGTVSINPVFITSMYRYYETGVGAKSHNEQVDYTYSPGALLIDTNAVDNNVQITSITWDNARNGQWIIPFNTGSNTGSITVRLSKQVAVDTPVTLTHYTDPSNLGGVIGVSFASNVTEPNGTSKTFTVPAKTNFVTVPISATAANSTNNPNQTPFYAWVVGNVGGATGQEATSKILIQSR
jgi:hypothetical protein